MSSIYREFKREAIIKSLSLNKYVKIMKMINDKELDISSSEEFQKVFNAFYRVRRDEEWRKKFYTYFENVKDNKEIKYEDILRKLYQLTGNIEASFSSKLLATINPNMPIWDRFVIKHFNIEVEGNTSKERIDDTIKKYYEILEKENKELEKEEIKEAIREFKEEFKEYNLSNIKILDYIIWSVRDEE